METETQRTELLLGNSFKIIQEASVMILGIGGVGSYCAEALARCGIGKLYLIDGDRISPSNLNRQLHANYETVGREKVHVMKERILTYRKDCEIVTHTMFYDASKNDMLFSEAVDFVVDAIDTVSSKLDIIAYCQQHQIPFISSMGMANRMDPTAVIVTELMKTTYDPLAKVIRSQARKRGLKKKIPVVFSTEQPKKQTKIINHSGKTRKEQIPPSSSSFVPAAAGLACASYAVRTIIRQASDKTDVKSADR